MNGLALCAEIGGLELGLKLALGDAYRTVGYVEREAFCAAVLVARMADAALDQAPIWGDITTFNGRPWHGKVGIISAGVPCQPVSYAGKRGGKADERWLWPHAARVVREMEPGIIFLEQVRGGVGAWLPDVLGSLADLGYDAEWDVFSAAARGAPHIRERLFVLAYAPECRSRSFEPGEQQEVWAEESPCCSAVGHPECTGSSGAGTRPQPARLFNSTRPSSQTMGNPDLTGLEGRAEPVRGSRDELPAWPPGSEDEDAWQAVIAQWPMLESAVCRVADGSASRVDRLRALGNGVVPLVAAHAFRTLAVRARMILGAERLVSYEVKELTQEKEAD